MSSKDFYLYIGGKRVSVTEEVYLEYRHSEDRERYFMQVLKKGRTIVNQEKMTVEYMPGREVSFEKLLEENWDFAAPGAGMDDMIARTQLLEKLEEALHSLTIEEMGLVQELFYLEKTEREAARLFQVSQNTIHYRKHKILDKLRKLLEEDI